MTAKQLDWTKPDYAEVKVLVNDPAFVKPDNPEGIKPFTVIRARISIDDMRRLQALPEFAATLNAEHIGYAESVEDARALCQSTVDKLFLALSN